MDECVTAAHEQWLLAQEVADAAARWLASHLEAGRFATADDLAELERLRADACAKLRRWMTVGQRSLVRSGPHASITSRSANMDYG